MTCASVSPFTPGHLPSGGARTARQLSVREASRGTFLIRVAVHGPARSTLESEQMLLDALSAARLPVDEGPDSAGRTAYRQSEAWSSTAAPRQLSIAALPIVAMQRGRAEVKRRRGRRGGPPPYDLTCGSLAERRFADAIRFQARGWRRHIDDLIRWK